MEARRSAPGFLVHTPSGPRKSGIPESVEIPAPVRTTTRLAASIHPRTTSIWSVGGTAPSIASRGLRAFPCSALRAPRLPANRGDRQRVGQTAQGEGALVLQREAVARRSERRPTGDDLAGASSGGDARRLVHTLPAVVAVALRRLGGVEADANLHGEAVFSPVVCEP